MEKLLLADGNMERVSATCWQLNGGEGVRRYQLLFEEASQANAYGQQLERLLTMGELTYAFILEWIQTNPLASAYYLDVVAD